MEHYTWYLSGVAVDASKDHNIVPSMIGWEGDGGGK